MKLNTAKNDLSTNATFESKDFGIGDPSVVIEILRNRLYAHPIRTLVQEYVSNGRDAIRETGQQRKLVINAPTRFQPTFRVRDYGVGITPARMNDVFVMYGSSTKRGTNNQTGGFGIGAKSAWSYTDSFTITTYVEGVKRIYVAHVGANQNGRLDLVNELATDEANGTEIEIAVKPNDISSFKDAICRAVYFWNEKEMPEIHGLSDVLNKPEKTVEISSEVQVFKDLPYYINRGQSGIHLVIDGIIYSLENGFTDKEKELNKFSDLFGYGAHIVLRLPNGLVEVSASREKLADSENTRKALSALATRWHAQTVKYCKEQFKSCNNIFDFSKVFFNFSGMINKSKLPNSFQGFTLDNDSAIRHDKLKQMDVIKVSNSFGRRRRRGYSNAVTTPQDKGLDKTVTWSIPIELAQHVFVMDTKESKVILNKRIRELLKTRTAILLFEVKEPKTPTANSSKITEVIPDPLTLEEIQEFAKELNAQQMSVQPLPIETKEEKEIKQKEKGAITIHKASYHMDTKDIFPSENTQKYIYASLEFSRQEIAELASFQKKDNVADSLCRLSKDAIKKIANDPNFVTIESFLAKFKVTDTLRTARKHRLALNRDTIRSLVTIKDTIVNEEMKKAVEMYENILSEKESLEVPTVLSRIVDADNEIAEFQKKDTELQALLESKYRLVKEIDLTWQGDKAIKQEMAFYINAKK